MVLIKRMRSCWLDHAQLNRAPPRVQSSGIAGRGVLVDDRSEKAPDDAGDCSSESQQHAAAPERRLARSTSTKPSAV